MCFIFSRYLMAIVIIFENLSIPEKGDVGNALDPVV